MCCSAWIQYRRTLLDRLEPAFQYPDDWAARLE
jgi:hypothetical protein